ncbi:MAG: NAD(P)-dependent oxidoreductase, partial [Bacteroidetes bacterium]
KDFIIHLAAIIPPLADDEPELSYRVNTTGTQNLIRNLEELSPDCFFLYSSSISVYGDRLKTPLIEVEDSLSPSEGDEYAKTKIKAEQIIRNSKLDWSIFRLAAIMVNHKVSKLMFHQPLATSFEIATPEDTARAFVNAIGNKQLVSKKTFNLGGGKNCRTTYKDFLSRSFSISGLGKLNFPKNTFAEKNFHCGFYHDGDDLENILRFGNDTLESYFEKEKLKISLWKKTLTSIFKNQIKNHLLKQSEPYNAFISNNNKMIKHFFN